MHADPECNVFILLDERPNMHSYLEDDSCDDATVRGSVQLTACASLLSCQPLSLNEEDGISAGQTVRKAN